MSLNVRGVEAAIDKNQAASLLAQRCARMPVLLIGIAAVEDGFGTPQARWVCRAIPADLRTVVPGRVHWRQD